MTKLATRTALKAATAPRRAPPFLVPQKPENGHHARSSAPAAPPSNLRLFTHAELIVSPFNARRDPRDLAPAPAFEASIAKRGILQPLAVHRLASGGFAIIAGQRRWLAVGRLIERGDVPADFPIPGIVRDVSEAELIEDSVHENCFRHELRDYEVTAAVLRAHDKGHDLAALAEGFGQDALWVRRQLVLARLHPEVFAAWARGDLSIEHARAYAATSDQALQLAVFDRLRSRPAWDREPSRIRAALGVADAELGRLLRFVGDAVYRDAGGRFELDLFADEAEARGRVVDAELLRGLVATRLAALRDETRAAAGRDLRFVSAPPAGEFGVDFALQILPDGDDPAKLPPGDVVATLEIAANGSALRRFWWSSRRAKTGKPERKPAPPKRPDGAALRTGSGFDGRAAQDANAAIREAEGLTATGVDVLRTLRREAMRAMLVDAAAQALQASAAVDYLAWAQLRMALGTRETSSETGIDAIHTGWTASTQPQDVARAIVKDMPAHERWEKARADIASAPFMRAKSPAESFALYRDETRAVKDLAAAVLTGLFLVRSLDADGYRVAVHDALVLELMHGHASNADQALRHWLPPSEALLGLIPGKELQALADPWIERATAGKFQRLKRPELVRAVFDLLAGTGQAFRTAGAKIAAMQWVHPLLKFGAANRPLAQVFESDPTSAETAGEQVQA